MIFPRPVQAVIFDMDGLLFDTESLFFAAMCAAGSECGHDVTEALFLSLVGLPRERVLEQLRAHYGQSFDAGLFHDDCTQRFFGLVESDLRLKDGAIALLDWLDNRDVPRAIATSSSRRNADHHLARFALAGRFDAVIAREDYERGKPDPDPFLTAARALSADPTRCLALEDSHNGVRAAAAAGMMTIMVPDRLPATAEMEELTIRIARDLDEVRLLLEERTPA